MAKDQLGRQKKMGVSSNGQGTPRKSLSQPLYRSPALEREENRYSAARNRNVSRPADHRRARRRKALAQSDMRQMRYSATNVLLPPPTMVKRLPGTKSMVQPRAASLKAKTSERVGLAMGWHKKNAEMPVTNRLARLAPPDPVAVLPDMPSISKEEQQRLAVLEMRLPRVAGRVDPILLVAVLALLCIGLVMVYSASSFISLQYYNDASYFFQKQLLGAVLGVILLFITMNIDYRFWRRFSLIGMVVALPMLIVVLLFGTSSYGASRWLGFGSFFSFQPSELIKLVLAFYIADWLARKGNQVSTFLYGLAPFVILVGTILGLVLLENDMGTATVIAVLATAMFFTAGANIFQFLLALAGGIAIFFTQAFHGYRYERLIGFLNPFQDVTGRNLQLYQSLLALGSGGFFGLGLGASRQKTGYLPLPYIDSIFAITGEELGYLGCALIIVLFLLLAFRGFRLARRTQDIYGALLATGITTWLVVQAMINIGATVGAIPYTGVPLPFISFGGTSLVISLAAVGVLLNISRYIREPEYPLLSRQTFDIVRQKRQDKGTTH
jgi:cell division protein FtsW